MRGKDISQVMLGSHDNQLAMTCLHDSMLGGLQVVPVPAKFDLTGVKIKRAASIEAG